MSSKSDTVNKEEISNKSSVKFGLNFISLSERICNLLYKNKKDVRKTVLSKLEGNIRFANTMIPQSQTWHSKFDYEPTDILVGEALWYYFHSSKWLFPQYSHHLYHGFHSEFQHIQMPIVRNKQLLRKHYTNLKHI